MTGERIPAHAVALVAAAVRGLADRIYRTREPDATQRCEIVLEDGQCCEITVAVRLIRPRRTDPERTP